MSERRWLLLPTRKVRPTPAHDGGPPAAPHRGGLEVAATVTGSSGMPLLTVSLSSQPPGGARPADTLVVIAAGEVDVDTAPLLRAALVDAVDRHRLVCCDLQAVTVLSAAGVSALLAAHRRAERTRSRLTVRGAQGAPAEVLRITGLDVLLRGK